MECVRIESLHLQNYGVFRGVHDFAFDRPRTLIVGANGAGKTTLANALAHLRPAPGVGPNYRDAGAGMAARVETTSNRGLIKKYKDIIFFDDELPHEPANTTVTPEVRAIFEGLLPRKKGRYQNLSPASMPVGDRMCLNVASAFAVRRQLKLDLPAVFDSPYGQLDSVVRERLRSFLKGNRPAKTLSTRCG